MRSLGREGADGNFCPEEPFSIESPTNVSWQGFDQWKVFFVSELGPRNASSSNVMFLQRIDVAGHFTQVTKMLIKFEQEAGLGVLLGEPIIPFEEMLWRFGMASFFGLLLGLDREMRGISAGVRTHMLVALSSAMTMLIALELFEELSIRGESDPDPSRAIHCLGVASANRAAARPGGSLGRLPGGELFEQPLRRGVVATEVALLRISAPGRIAQSRGPTAGGE